MLKPCFSFLGQKQFPTEGSVRGRIAMMEGIEDLFVEASVDHLIIRHNLMMNQSMFG